MIQALCIEKYRARFEGPAKLSIERSNKQSEVARYLALTDVLFDMDKAWSTGV
jgi:hypothetical protein